MRRRPGYVYAGSVPVWRREGSTNHSPSPEVPRGPLAEAQLVLRQRGFIVQQLDRLHGLHASRWLVCETDDVGRHALTAKTHLDCVPDAQVHAGGNPVREQTVDRYRDCDTDKALGDEKRHAGSKGRGAQRRSSNSAISASISGRSSGRFHA